MSTLVVAPAWLGDAVMAQPLIARLAEAYPAAQLEVLAPPATAQAFERMPGVDRVHRLEVAHGALDLGPRLRAARMLSGRRFERAFVLPNTWKSALTVALARIPERIGYVGEFRHGLLTRPLPLDAARYPRLVDRYARLAGPLDPALPRRPVLRAAPAPARSALRARLGLGHASRQERPVLALCPGAAFGSAKRWPARHFGALASRRLAAGWQVWLLGAPDDAATARAVRSACVGDAVHDLTGRTGLAEAMDLLADASAVVSNDSGLMHVAAALGRPVLGLFGPTSSASTPPLGVRSRALDLRRPCAPCFARDCPLGHGACLAELTPPMVDAALQGLLDGTPAEALP